MNTRAMLESRLQELKSELNKKKNIIHIKLNSNVAVSPTIFDSYNDTVKQIAQTEKLLEETE